MRMLFLMSAPKARAGEKLKAARDWAGILHSPRRVILVPHQADCVVVVEREKRVLEDRGRCALLKACTCDGSCTNATRMSIANAFGTLTESVRRAAICLPKPELLVACGFSPKLFGRAILLRTRQESLVCPCGVADDAIRLVLFLQTMVRLGLNNQSKFGLVARKLATATATALY
jgi:hypothetical protein